MLLKLQSITKSFKNVHALNIASYMFLILPMFILGFVYTFMAQGQIEKMLNNPMIVGQILIVFAMPFCYLLLKKIRLNIKEETERKGMLLPLWILLLYQVSSFNMVCSFLLLYGTYQEYGKEMFSIKQFHVTKQTKTTIGALIPLGLLYLLVLFVKFRLGLLF